MDRIFFGVMCHIADCVPQGKKNFSIYLPHHVTCITALNVKRSRTTAALIVGLANGEVRVYNEKSLVS